MKKLILLSLVLCPFFAFAQTSLDEEVKAELDLMYNQQQAEIQNEQQSAETLDNKVLSVAKTESADKKPNVEEASKETAVAEKKEQTEKKQIEEAKLNTQSESPAASAAAKSEVSTDSSIENIQQAEQGVAQSIQQLSKVENSNTEKDGFYVSVLVGAMEYADLANLTNDYSTGLAVGKNVTEKIILEGALLSSRFSYVQAVGASLVDSSVDQLNANVLVKYQFLSGMFKPELGAILGYTNRGFSSASNSVNSNVSTDAIDVGVMAGLDIRLFKHFSIGADIRYMSNLSSNQTAQSRQATSSQGVAGNFENSSYLSSSIVGRASF